MPVNPLHLDDLVKRPNSFNLKVFCRPGVPEASFVSEKCRLKSLVLVLPMVGFTPTPPRECLKQVNTILAQLPFLELCALRLHPTSEIDFAAIRMLNVVHRHMSVALASRKRSHGYVSVEPPKPVNRHARKVSQHSRRATPVAHCSLSLPWGAS